MTAASAATATVVAGSLLITLSAASLGCVFVAFYGVGEAAPQQRTLPVMAIHAPTMQPVANKAEPLRCADAHGKRARRSAYGACRIPDLPPV